ncbi:site-specific integrase [Trinickia sp. NRRL B-1857]|uniref:tyrosine-type recombinase/integrase n=1 Tax=Trinickia sp. NRRL B-1857 TaxID=3162879 RepID=UPI003D2D39B9
MWHVDIRAPGGGRVRQTTGTTNRKEAQEYHDKLKHDLWRVSKMGEKPKRTFGEAVVRFMNEKAEQPDFRNKRLHMRHFREKFSGRDLASITRDEIYEALPQVNQRKKREVSPVSRATKNLYLSTIRSMFNMAADEWGWIASAPKLPNLAVDNKRIRWITREEAQRLLQAIHSPWMRDVTTLAFATGLRQSNLLDLEWSQVDLIKRRAWIHPDQAKARKSIGIPLNDEAVEVIRRQIGKHQTRVFSRRGKPIIRWDLAQWNRAVARAELEHFRFHDVRHTWASWHVQSGTPLNRLMELGGWSKYEHVLRYAHLAPDHLAEHAATVTIWAQNPKEVNEESPQSLVA